MSATIKTILINAAPVGAGAMGAVLGDMAGFGLAEWMLLAGVIVISILSGAFFVRGEARGQRFWAGVAVKLVLGGGAALATGGSLKILLPLLIAIGVADPALLIKTGRKLGLIAGDDDGKG